jgi:hypothetical protein
MVVNPATPTKPHRHKNTSFTAKKLLTSEPTQTMTIRPV